MISIILGHKGAGKTKRLISCVNEAVENSKGNVVCVEKETKLTYDVNYRARLVATDEFAQWYSRYNSTLESYELWIETYGATAVTVVIILFNYFTFIL